MGGNSFGTSFRITTFGESHGAALGVIIDGVPAGLPIDMDFVQYELARRRPGQSALTTARQEGDAPEIVSGVLNGVATGTPLTIIIRNTDQRSRDYSKLEHTFRPGHADYGYNAKYGIRDVRGGGRSSGRETAARVAAGAVAAAMAESTKEKGSSLPQSRRPPSTNSTANKDSKHAITMGAAPTRLK